MNSRPRDILSTDHGIVFFDASTGSKLLVPPPRIFCPLMTGLTSDASTGSKSWIPVLGHSVH